jgi:hypothetical protein
MSFEDPERDELFQNDGAQMAHETRQAGRTAGAHERSSNRTRHGGFTVTLRLKPDRRCLVIPVDPANERRRP